jgi:hypothetical protein
MCGAIMHRKKAEAMKYSKGGVRVRRYKNKGFITRINVIQWCCDGEDVHSGSG